MTERQLPLFTPEEAEAIHVRVMAEDPGQWHGLRDHGLLASALMRPVHAILYENADVAMQAATLLWGLVKAHAFLNGNKRTAWAITKLAVLESGYRLEAPHQAILDLVFGIDNEGLRVEDVAVWFRAHLAG